MQAVEKYKQIFQIPDNISIQLEPVPQGQELIFSPEENKAILKVDKYSYGDIPELIAHLKLGIDYHPLLATFYFQKDLSQEEAIFAKDFYMLIAPVIDVWVWKTMKKYLPAKEFKHQLNQLIEIYEKAQLYKMHFGKDTEDELLKRRMSFSYYLILKNLGYNAKLKLIGKGKQLQEWIRYKKLLVKIARNEPNIEDLISIPEQLNAPYRVYTSSQPHWHYVITKNTQTIE